MKYLAFDPGDHTGVMYYDSSTDSIIGWTIERSLLQIKNILLTTLPDVIVYERFALYPDKARQLSWNTFYPCEVIGVIKLWCEEHDIIPIVQGADKKKYSGGIDGLRSRLGTTTQHEKDAFMHLQYYLRSNGKGVIT